MADTDDWARKKALHLVRVEHGLRGPSSYDMVDDIASALRDARREGIEEVAQLYDREAKEANSYWLACADDGDSDGVRVWARREMNAEAEARRVRALAAGGKAE